MVEDQYVLYEARDVRRGRRGRYNTKLRIQYREFGAISFFLVALD